MRVIVVEDEFTSRQGIVQLIPSVDPRFEVVGQAVDGCHGLELIKSLQPDVAFVDIRMPNYGWDGIDVFGSGDGHRNQICGCQCLC